VSDRHRIQVIRRPERQQRLRTLTLFIDCVVYRGGYDPATLPGVLSQYGDQKPRRSLTMIAVTRPAVTTLLTIRMLLTPLGTP
jgi:hypothetical protein